MQVLCNTKINLKWTTAPHVLSKAIELLEKESESISLTWDRADSLKSTVLKALFMKEKIATLDFIKIKNFSSSKDIVKATQRLRKDMYNR